MLDAYDGVTLVEGPDGDLEGYVSWQRGAGYGPEARLTVPDALSRTGRATTALLATLGSWASVVGTVALRICEPDPLVMALPMDTVRIEKVEPWMLRVLDAPGAVAGRGWPPHLSGSLDLHLLDRPEMPGGACRLVLEAGEGRLEPGGGGALRLTPGGFAALYAGGATTSVVRRAGGLEGGTPAMDVWADAAFAGPRPAILDYF